MKEYTTSRLVKSEDLNHHGTLFAGRTAEWFVEACFVAAAITTKNPESIVCLNIHGLTFRNPVKKGDIITFTTKVANLGSTSLVVYGSVESETAHIKPVEGYITFICVDENGKKLPHGLVLDEPADEEEVRIRERAINLLKK